MTRWKVIDEYGADALRFMLATGNAPGNDMRYSDDKVKAARNFANKLWNASRFIMMNLPENFQYNGLPEDLELEDRWIVSKFNAVAKEVSENLDKFETRRGKRKDLRLYLGRFTATGILS